MNYDELVFACFFDPDLLVVPCLTWHAVSPPPLPLPLTGHDGSGVGGFLHRMVHLCGRPTLRRQTRPHRAVLARGISGGPPLQLLRAHHHLLTGRI